MHRFYFNEVDKDSEFIEFSGEISHQIINVLRMKSNDLVEVFNGEGLNAITKINVENSGTKVIAKVISQKNVLESNLKIDVYQSIIKSSKLELTIEKLTELGISSFTPIITERSQKKDIISLSDNKINRLKKISIESAEQSGKSFVPEIRNIEKFANLLMDKNLNNPFLFYENNEGSESLNDINLNEYKDSNLSIFIGPVGGFSENEINLSRDSGFRIVNIGDTILKSDTAAIVSCALLRYLIENNLS
ncbi:MAG: RsmE family RNA methyltransferase [Chloroflexota bacterium]|nr:RsmE family RNA methyltransferase [Chloroflexota bacterium]